MPTHTVRLGQEDYYYGFPVTVTSHYKSMHDYYEVLAVHALLPTSYNKRNLTSMLAG